jgi:hypothetical protein
MHMVDLPSPPKDSKNSGAFGDKGKGSRRRTHQTVAKRTATNMLQHVHRMIVWMTL